VITQNIPKIYTDRQMERETDTDTHTHTHTCVAHAHMDIHTKQEDKLVLLVT